MPIRPVTYLVWPAVSMLLGFLVLTIFGPHPALFVLGTSLIGFFFLIAIGEIAPWAQNRGIENPTKFSASIGGYASVAWILYVLVVSLPIGFFTDLPTSRIGRSIYFWLTLLPLPLLYLAVWTVKYQNITKKPSKTPSGLRKR
jgi:general stress protein CsbA